MNPDRNSRARTKAKRTPRRRPGAVASETDKHQKGDVAEQDTLKRLLGQWHELGEYFSYFVNAKADGVRVFLRNLSLRIVLAVLAFICVCGLIVSANWFVLSGTADALGLLCGGRMWLGKIIAGFLFLAVLGLCIGGVVTMRWRASQERAVQKYEKRQAEQKEEFGRSVREQSAASSQQE